MCAMTVSKLMSTCGNNSCASGGDGRCASNGAFSTGVPVDWGLSQRPARVDCGLSYTTGQATIARSGIVACCYNWLCENNSDLAIGYGGGVGGQPTKCRYCRYPASRDITMATIFVFLYVECTLAPPDEYDWTVRVWQQCSLMSNYFDHLLLGRIPVLRRCDLLLQRSSMLCLYVGLPCLWAVQKQLKWSWCRLGCGLGWAQGTMH